MDLALNNLQRLICHKTQTNKQTKEDQLWSRCHEPNQTKPNQTKLKNISAELETTNIEILSRKINELMKILPLTVSEENNEM